QRAWRLAPEPAAVRLRDHARIQQRPRRRSWEAAVARVTKDRHHDSSPPGIPRRDGPARRCRQHHHHGRPGGTIGNDRVEQALFDLEYLTSSSAAVVQWHSNLTKQRAY